MEMLKFETVELLNEACANHIIKELQHKRNSLISFATGNSPTGIYKKLNLKKKLFDSTEMKFIKLDEWAQLPMKDEGSCEHYVQKYLLEPLDIPRQSFTSFNSMVVSPEKECLRIQKYLDKNGPIDICLLGLGVNGHVAFNEPAEYLQPKVHYATLSQTSLDHSMVKNKSIELKNGYTLGMANILQSKTVLLVVHGIHKKEILKKLMNDKITTHLPASFLWLHPNAFCYYCYND
ncbi:MAG: galactosamine-6-phosphate isomerase [Ginsengibacter sp.]